MIPSRFAYCDMPCLSCGGAMVCNGPALPIDLEVWMKGEATMVEYVCSNCPEHWGFYGERHPDSQPIGEMLAELGA